MPLSRKASKRDVLTFRSFDERILYLLQKGDLSIYYELGEGEDIMKRGIVEVDRTTGR